MVKRKNNNNFSESESKVIVKYILEGLDHMEKFKIMHRDLKPENILY